MAYEIPGFLITFPSAADFSAKDAGKFRFVNMTNTGKVQNPTAGGHAVGVRQIQPRVNEACTVMVTGISFIEAGGAFTAGDMLASDATGRAVKAAAGQQVLGRALESAPASGIQATVLLTTPTGAV